MDRREAEWVSAMNYEMEKWQRRDWTTMGFIKDGFWNVLKVNHDFPP